MSALYIHIPFCKTQCNYCDFYKSTSYAKTDAYIEALEKEMDFQKDFLKDTEVKTIYFGGGTPSLLEPSVLQHIINQARKIWNIDKAVEITVEINPDDATDEYLTKLAATDVNRISFGLQSFIDRDLQFLGRRHNAKQGLDAVKKARELGFKNISIDLIFGIPGMSMKEWEKNIVKAIVMDVEHISAYHLTIEPNTPFGKMADDGDITPVDENESEEQYQTIHRLLTDAGFTHYEISNYSRGMDLRSKHNCAYWSGEKYLGLGPSAHSFDGNQRSFVVNRLKDYLDGAGTDAIYGKEMLSSVDKYNEYVMVALRTCCGVQRDQLTKHFGLEGLLYFEYGAEKFLRQGLLVRDENNYKIPPEKFMISNSIISDLFYVEEG